MKSLFDQKKVLITGGAGFIGSHLVEKFLSLGANVFAVDNLITGSKKNINEFFKNDHFFFIEADINEGVNQYWPKQEKIDYVLHFASPASPPLYQQHPRLTYLVNSCATDNILKYLLDYSPDTIFLFASTSEIYGDPLVHPQTESYFGNVNPNGIRSCYDESKRLGETICGVFNRDYGLDTRIIRIFNTYGPKMHPADGRVIPNIIMQILRNEKITIYGDGKQTRSFIFINDLVAGIIKMLEKDIKGQTINLGNPLEITINKLVEILQKIITDKIDKNAYKYMVLPKDDPTKRKPDISLAQSVLNWSPQVSLEDGLTQTIAYFKQL